MVHFRNATITFLLLIELFLTVTCRNDFARSTTRLCNSGRGKILEIGIRGQRPKISVCFNPNRQLTYWTSHYLATPASCPQQRRDPTWLRAFFTFNPSPLYSRSPSTDKGHFSPVCDFDTKDEQDMTFYYINAAPQFSTLNRGNWKSLERSLRDRVRRGRALKVITGAVGSLAAVGGRLNVPKYFFKVVVAPGNRREVFVGFNTPASIRQDLCDAVIPRCGWTGQSTIICCRLTARLLGRLGLESRDVSYR